MKREKADSKQEKEKFPHLSLRGIYPVLQGASNDKAISMTI